MTGGGAATNSGIDFQHRVGALGMVTMLTNIADLDVVGLGDPGERPTRIRFETANGVNNIVIALDEGQILVPRTNTISLSTGADSEFAKVIRQFVAQSRHDVPNERYVLAVSPGASAKIRLDLKKLCESYRLNETDAGQNPLTANERQVLDAVNAHIDREFKDVTGSVCNEQFRIDLLRRIHIQTFDVAEGGTTERLAITALTLVTRTEPTLLWRNLIAICLRLARDRLSIDMAGLSSRLGILVSPPAGAKDRMRGDADNSRPRVERTGALSMGREVLLACDEDNRIIITEFRRFNEDGTRRPRFVNGYVELPRGIRWLVMGRQSNLLPECPGR